MPVSNGQAQILQPEEIQQLRNEVLWPHKTFENCVLETDRLSTTFHFGVQIDGLTVATVRGQGIGDAIIEAGFNYLRELGVEVVWCDARVAALNFYRRLQFEELEEEYDIPIIGLHRFMWKVLSSQV